MTVLDSLSSELVLWKCILHLILLDTVGSSLTYRLKRTPRVAALCPVLQVGARGVVACYSTFLKMITNEFKNIRLLVSQGSPWKTRTVRPLSNVIISDDSIPIELPLY